MAIRPVTRAGVGLVIGIIILAALVFAGLWYVRERGEQAQRQEAINIAEEQLKAESDKDVAIDSDKNKDENKESEEAIPQGGTGGAQPADSNELPQTGPADQFGAVLMVGAVTYLLARYLAARKVTSVDL